MATKVKKQTKNKPKIENFGENNNTGGFHVNPENINQEGRPRILISSINEELKKKGVEPVKPSQIVDCFETLLNLTSKEITEIADNENNPLFIRVIAKNMSSQRNFEIIEKMIDRAHGRAVQPITGDLTVTWEESKTYKPDGTNP